MPVYLTTYAANYCKEGEKKNYKRMINSTEYYTAEIRNTNSQNFIVQSKELAKGVLLMTDGLVISQ